LPVVVLVPAFGGKRLPLQVKIGLSATISMALLALVEPRGSPPGGLLFLGLLLKEVAIGTVLALAGACLFEAMRIGGQMIDLFRGSSAASALVPQSGERVSPLGDLHLLLAVSVFFSASGPELFARALLSSFEQLPLDVFPAVGTATEAGELAITLTAQALRMGLSIALPAAFAILAVDCLLGFINRTAPQIQVFFLGMPLRVVVGIAIVALTLEGSMGRFLALVASAC